MRVLTHLGLAALIAAPAATLAQNPAPTPPPQTTSQTQAPTPAQTTTPSATQAATTPDATSKDTAAAPPKPLTKEEKQDQARAAADAKKAQLEAEHDKEKEAAATKKAEVDAKKAAEQAKLAANSMPSPGEDLKPNIKPGTEEDVNSIGSREIFGRGMGNWYSTNWEIRVGKQYSLEIEKSAHLVTDPVIVEYVNRIGQNLVKNSDAKIPFTIKVIDSDEVNAMALPGGFFYVNSGLILACDEEAELAGVMAHEISHVIAHHAARQQTKMNYATIASIPLIIFTQGSWTGYGIYEASQLAIPMSFLMFSRAEEAEADYLGVQYMYHAGYDPQSFITLFEKLDALEKHKPGSLAKAFSDHPQTPDRIAASEDEIATILPAKPDYIVTTSEFDDVKARLARLENKRKINDKNGGSKPTLRRADGSNNPGSSNPSTSTDDQPTLGRRN